MLRKNTTDLKTVLKKAIELTKPNLNSYCKIVRKAQIVKSYPSNGNYYADVQPLRNDESVDFNEPVIRQVEIPVIWAGPDKGIICPPTVGSHCDLSYYDGDPNYPRISNFRWHGNNAPTAAMGDLVIQSKNNTQIKISANNNIEIKTPNNIKTDSLNIKITASGNVNIEAGGNVTINAAQIISTAGGAVAGNVTGNCLCNLLGLPHSDSSATVLSSK